jgi:hypothetical protein
MTCDDAVLLLDDYVDAGCEPDVAASVQRHLAACPTCRAVAEDISRIRGAAGALGPIAPPARVWTGIQARLHAGDAAASGRWRQFLAAAAGFALVASSLSWLGTRLQPPAPGISVASGEPVGRFQVAEAAYQSAIDDLESITAQAETPALAEPAFAALQAGLADVDAAIDEARGRLSVEPDDEFSQESLLAALDSKVILLQDTVALLDQDGMDLEVLNR